MGTGFVTVCLVGGAFCKCLFYVKLVVDGFISSVCYAFGNFVLSEELSSSVFVLCLTFHLV